MQQIRLGAEPNRRDRLHRFFLIGLWLKAANSVLEIVGAVLLSVLSTADILRLVNAVTQNELLDDPNDPVAGSLLRWAEHLSGSNLRGAALFLASHGVIKLGLVVGVLLGVRGAYPAFIVALIVLIAYQSYQLIHAVSIGLLLLTALDIVVLVLTVREYQSRRAKIGH